MHLTKHVFTLALLLLKAIFHLVLNHVFIATFSLTLILILVCLVYE